MRNFEFMNTTKLIFGKGQLEKIKDEIPKYGKRVLVTYGGGSIKSFGLYDKIMAILREMDVSVFEFSGIEPNPRHTTANKGIEICKKEKIDFILAVGGGSVIDCTKLIAAGARSEVDSWDIVENKYTPKDSLPFGTVLTIPATGSEMNMKSVITNWSTNQKHSWGSPLSFPKFSILDPENTYSVPLDQTVFGIVDIMAHVIEQYFHNDTNTPLQDRMCEGLLRTVINVSPKLIKDLTNYEYRETILYCGTIALNGYLSVGSTGDWASHKIGHAVSAVHDVPHGASLAILIPSWMRQVLPYNVSRFKQFAIEVYDVDSVGKSDEDIALEGIERNSEFWKSLGAPTKLSDYNVGKQDIDSIVEKPLARGTIGFVKQLDVNDVRSIYLAAL